MSLTDYEMEHTMLARLVRQATQYARLRTTNPLVGFVGAALRIWVVNGLVTQEQAKAFDEALLQAGTELALAPQPQARNHEAAAAKGAARPGHVVDLGADAAPATRAPAQGRAVVSTSTSTKQKGSAPTAKRRSLKPS